MMKDRSGYFAATLSLTEIVLGSFLHAFHIPMAGHFLSINEGLLLTFSIKKMDKPWEAAKTSASVATVSALLKSLSPAGKKMLPMLAIAVQGLLYSAGIALGGCNAAGVIIGMIFLSTWAYIQPLLMAYLLFGQAFFEGILKIWTETTQWIGLSPEHSEKLGIWILISLVTLKLLTASVLGYFAWNSEASFEKKYFDWMERYSQKTRLIFSKAQTSSSSSKDSSKHQSKGSAFSQSMKDLANPIFVFSLLLSLSFVFFATQKDYKEVGIYLLRTLSIAWLVFFIIRVLPADPLLRLIKKYPQLQEIFIQAQEELAKRS